MGAGNHPRTRKERKRGPRDGGKGHHGKRHDPHPGRAYHDGGTSAAPPPPNAPRLPGAHPPTHTAEASIGHRTHRTHRTHRKRTPTSHRKPHGEWKAQRHGENGPHPQRKPQGTPQHGAPPRPNRQATTPAATRATSQAPEEDECMATATRTRDRNPPRTRDQGADPQGGQPHGPSRDRPTQPTSPSGTPKPPQRGPSETPTPNRSPQPPASHTPARTPHHDTGQADLHSPTAAQHETTAHRTTARHSATRHSTTRRDAAQTGTTRHN